MWNWKKETSTDKQQILVCVLLLQFAECGAVLSFRWKLPPDLMYIRKLLFTTFTLSFLSSNLHFCPCRIRSFMNSCWHWILNWRTRGCPKIQIHYIINCFWNVNLLISRDNMLQKGVCFASCFPNGLYGRTPSTSTWAITVPVLLLKSLKIPMRMKMLRQNRILMTSKLGWRSVVLPPSRNPRGLTNDLNRNLLRWFGGAIFVRR